MSAAANLSGMTVAAALLSYAPAIASVHDVAQSRTAAEAYQLFNSGDAAGAAEAARRAVEEEPANLDYRLLLADALTRAGRTSEALAVLTPLADRADYRVQARLAQAAYEQGRLESAIAAFSRAAGLADDAEARAYLTRAAVLATLEAGRADEAGRMFDAAWAEGVLQDHDLLDAANVALAVGRDAQAQWAFARADARDPLTGRAALDAGYSARRLGLDQQALRYFQRGLATWPANDPELGSARRFEIEGAVRDLGGDA